MITKKDIAIIDLGKNQGTFLFQDDSSVLMNNDSLLEEALKLPKGSTLVSEHAHLGVPRKDMSRAQPFTANELVQFYNALKSNGIELRLFPQGLTPRALNYYRMKHGLDEKTFEKSDLNDPLAIREFLLDHPHYIKTLAKPKEDFSKDPLIEEGHQMVKSINTHLNYARGTDKSYSEPDDMCLQFIKDNIDLFAKLASENTKNVFGFNDDGAYFKIKKKAGLVNIKKIKLTQIYSIVACMIDYRGNLRLRPNTNQIAGVGFFRKRLLRLHPYHKRGGVARSNINHHGVKHYVKNHLESQGCSLKNPFDPKQNSNHRGHMNQIQNELFLISRKEYKDALIECYQIFKRIAEGKCDDLKNFATIELPQDQVSEETASPSNKPQLTFEF